jgi:hypothetical protein
MFIGDPLMVADTPNSSMTLSPWRIAETSRGMKLTEWWIRVAIPPPFPTGRSFLRRVYPGKEGSLDLAERRVSWMQATLILLTWRKLLISAREFLTPLQLNWRNVWLESWLWFWLVEGVAWLGTGGGIWPKAWVKVAWLEEGVGWPEAELAVAWLDAKFGWLEAELAWLDDELTWLEAEFVWLEARFDWLEAEFNWLGAE